MDLTKSTSAPVVVDEKTFPQASYQERLQLARIIRDIEATFSQIIQRRDPESLRGVLLEATEKFFSLRPAEERAIRSAESELRPLLQKLINQGKAKLDAKASMRWSAASALASDYEYLLTLLEEAPPDQTIREFLIKTRFDVRAAQMKVGTFRAVA